MKKTYRNDGQGEDNSLQNHFTSYVEKALSNNRITYKRKLTRQHRLQLMEDMDSEMVSFNQEQNSPVEEMYEEQYACETDLVENLSLLFALQRLSEAEAEKAAANYPGMLKVLVGGVKEGWHDFNVEMERFSSHFNRTEKTPCGNDPMLMLFTSGTTGYPRIATHSYKYALGHYPTAKHWHNVNPNGLHFTISDTGWGKALWGKLYSQWLCEAAQFTYDFDRFHSEDILPMFAKYHITTFCAPPTMYRFFIRKICPSTTSPLSNMRQQLAKR